jgi:hypothetical protein
MHADCHRLQCGYVVHHCYFMISQDKEPVLGVAPSWFNALLFENLNNLEQGALHFHLALR